jgi:chemotaxis protein methyltransferase CheR
MSGTGDPGPILRLAEREFVLTDHEFQRLRDLIHQQTGIALSDAKRELLYGRLARRLRKLGLASFAEYCKVLEEQSAPGEMQELTNAITTNLTSFFREEYHFRQLAEEALAQIIETRSAVRRLRLWSAGCSTGEEPYTLAMVLREALAELHNWDVKLLATDIDSKVVATASGGIYAAERLKGVSAERRARWFQPAPGDPGCYTASEELKSLITFKQLNLLDAWPMKGIFDVIFCRNVVIYFDKPTQRELFERMAEHQEPGGWLFIGHSENLLNVTRRYKLVGRTVYRRVG